MGRGGGNDGGVCANNRAFMVKEKTEDRGARDRERKFAADRLLHCALSGDALVLPASVAAGPIVCDRLGNLFLKEAILAYVLEKRDLPAFSHIRSLKRDVFAVNLCGRRAAGGADLPAASRSTADGAGAGSDAGMYYCPLTGEEASGAHAFVALRSCGCVMSERALRELGTARPASSGGSGSAGAGAAPGAAASARAAAELCCPACSAPVPSDVDVVRLAPTEEEAAVMRAALQKEKEKDAGEGKGKERKGKARADKGDEPVSSAAAAPGFPLEGNGLASSSSSAASAGASAVGSKRPHETKGHDSAPTAVASVDAAAPAPAGKRSRLEASSESASATASAAASGGAGGPHAHVHAHAHAHVHAHRHGHGHGHGHAQVMRDDSGLASRASEEASRAIEQRKAASSVYSSLFKSSTAASFGSAGAGGAGAGGAGAGGAGASSRAGGSMHTGRW